MRALPALFALLLPVVAQAQTWPEKTVRLIVAVAPGGGTDILARQLARRLIDVFSQQVIVDNRPGAGAVLGTEIAAKATDDEDTDVGTMAEGPELVSLEDVEAEEECKDLPIDDVEIEDDIEEDETFLEEEEEGDFLFLEEEDDMS